MIGDSPEAGSIRRGDSDDRSLDAVLHALADERRRNVLACLSEHSRPIALADLAEDVALRESGGPITAIPRGEVLKVQVVLHHHHVPKLVDAGAVEYDMDRDQVQLTEPTDAVEHALSVATDGGTRQ